MLVRMGVSRSTQGRKEERRLSSCTPCIPPCRSTRILARSRSVFHADSERTVLLRIYRGIIYQALTPPGAVETRVLKRGASEWMDDF